MATVETADERIWQREWSQLCPEECAEQNQRVSLLTQCRVLICHACAFHTNRGKAAGITVLSHHVTKTQCRRNKRLQSVFFKLLLSRKRWFRRPAAKGLPLKNFSFRYHAYILNILRA